MSVYSYLKNGGNGKADIPFQKMIHDKYPTFDQFVMDYLDKDVIHQITLLRPQYAFVCNCKYEIMVDFCGKFENIDEDFSVICESLGIKKSLPKLNKTDYKSGKNKQHHLSKDVIGKINYLYKKDFEVFGYDLMQPFVILVDDFDWLRPIGEVIKEEVDDENCDAYIRLFA